MSIMGSSSEVGPDHLRDKRVDAFVVGGVRVRREDGVDFALGVRLHEVREIVVDAAFLNALVDDVEPLAGRPVDQIAVVHLQLVPLGEHRAGIFGEYVVVEVVLVARAVGEDGERRILVFQGEAARKALPKTLLAYRLAV